MRAARAARLFFAIRPIKLLICDVIPVTIVDVKGWFARATQTQTQGQAQEQQMCEQPQRKCKRKGMKCVKILIPCLAG